MAPSPPPHCSPQPPSPPPSTTTYYSLLTPSECGLCPLLLAWQESERYSFIYTTEQSREKKKLNREGNVWLQIYLGHKSWLRTSRPHFSFALGEVLSQPCCPLLEEGSSGGSSYSRSLNWLILRTWFLVMKATILSPFFLFSSTQTEGPESSGPSILVLTTYPPFWNMRMPKPEIISMLYANQPSFVVKLFYVLIGNGIQHGDPDSPEKDCRPQNGVIAI